MIEWSAWKSCWRTEWCSTMQFVIHEGNSTVKGLSRTHGLHHRSSRILICGVPARNITVTVFFLRIYFCRQIAYGPLRSHVRSLHREDAAIQVDVSYLSVLPHTRPYVQATLSLVDFNWRVQEFNDLVLADSLRRDHVWVWNHIFLQAGLAFFL